MDPETQDTPSYTQTITQRYISTSSREILIDYFRGFAVALMIITHVVALTYNSYVGNNQLVEEVGRIGGIGSFTSFLFLSGIGAYFGFLKISNEQTEKLKDRRIKTIIRALQVLGIYYLLALGSVLVNTSLLGLPVSADWGETIVKILSFQIVPEFTEFLIPLAFFAFTLPFLRKIYKFLLREKLVGLLAIILIFALGNTLYSVEFDISQVDAFKSLFAGNKTEHTFPIFQYFPIYLLGIYFAQFWDKNTDSFKRLKLTALWLIAALGFFIQASVTFEILNLREFNPLPLEGRFPPSLGFLALSMAIALASLLILGLFKAVVPGVIKAWLHFMGTNPLEMFFFHTMILFTFKYLTQDEYNAAGQQYTSMLAILIIFIIVIGASIFLTNLKNQFREWSLEDSRLSETWWVFSERAVSTFIFIIIFSIVGTTFYKQVLADNSADSSSSIQFKKRLIREEEWPIWWDHTYNAFRQIIIDNKSGNVYYEKEWVRASFNHSESVSNGNSIDASGNDIRVVYYDNALGEFKEISFVLESPNSTESKISFQLEDAIQADQSVDNYFIYYGKANNGNYPKSNSSPSGEIIANDVSVQAEKSHSITANTNRKWHLKKKETAYQAASLEFRATITSSDISASPIVTYTIPGTDKFGRMESLGNGSYKADVVVSDLQPGSYYVQANVTESGNNLKIYRSKQVDFKVTYPLYVTWTQDWEGFDVSENNLNAMANTADTFGMPMVHLFNPRIYVDNQYSYSISQKRAQELTEWVKQRQKTRFEEIGMHIHMWADMVISAGVQPKYQTAVGGAMYGDDLTYLYSESELVQIFSWGRQKFGENDLGAPITYRTGGWMSGPQVLKAAESTGFLIDTTGRTPGPINPANPASTPVPWNLTETTYPYLPSVNDINAWSGDRLDIWEFPNNGADSYWFSEGELRRRFDSNYPDKNNILVRPQVVTYLTHPHWYQSVDEGKVRGLLSYISQFKLDSDNGPVVFATLDSIYSQWPRDTFYNGN